MDEFYKRRQKLAKSMQPNSLAILIGAKLQYRNKDVAFPFRQESNFYYLSGIKEPNSIIMLHKNKNNKLLYYIFYEKLSKLQETWVGKYLDKNIAIKNHNANFAYGIKLIETAGILDTINSIKSNNANKKINPQMLKLFKTAENFYLLAGVLDEIKNKNIKASKSKTKLKKNFYNLTPILNKLRLVKSKEEIAYIKKAASISIQAHKQLMKFCKPGVKEYQMAAKFNYIVQNKGCDQLAYQTIVGSGANACTLHYIKNDATLLDGDLVLVDAGGEYNYYAADITRTYPINGKFSDAQSKIYNLVLKAQQEGIALINPGNTWDMVSEKIIDVIVSGLIELKILKGNKKNIIKTGKNKEFCLHSFGHFLGLDVHDVGTIKEKNKWIEFKPGIILTVEPGIYIAKDNKTVLNKWRGIGVRIEDNILVTKTGNKNLTENLPKDIKAIEALMKKN